VKRSFAGMGVVMAMLLSLPEAPRVMFLGDSYTQYDFGGGFKPHVYHYLDSLGYSVTYLGRDSTQNNSDVPYFNGAASTSYLAWDWPRTQMWHEGVASKQAYHWATGTGSATPSSVTEAVTANTPDILTIYIGLNDISNGTFTTTQIRNNIDSMLTQAWAVSPSMRIILSNLAKTKNTSWYDSINALNAKIYALVVAKQAAGKFILFMDADAGTDSTDFDGSSHPTASYGTTKWSGGNRKLALLLAPLVRLAIDSNTTVPPETRTRYLLRRRT
jgi:hypothetical protein